MKRSSMLSRVFFRRAAVKELVPDLKLVLTVVTVGCESHIGVYRPAGLGDDTGLVPSSLAGALADLERRGHILTDGGTGELFITDFFRDNTFSNAARQGQARDDFAQIESAKLRTTVLRAIAQNPSCGLKSATFPQNQEIASQGKGEGKGKGKEAAAPRACARGTDSAAASPNRSNAKREHPTRIAGMDCWYPSEDPEAHAIVATYDQESIKSAVAAIKLRPNSAGKKTSPVPALVKAELEHQQQGLDAAARRAKEDAELRVRALGEIDPVAQAKGQQLLPATLRTKLQQTSTTQETTA